MELLSRRAFTLLLAAWGVPCAARAQTAAAADELHEHEVKAAFVFKFGEFVEWPAQALGAPNAPFTFAVVGADPIAEVLEQLGKQRRIHGRLVVVRRVQRAEAVLPAHIVFIGAGESDRLLRAAGEQLKAASTLTVTEVVRPSQASGLINFVVRESRVRFEIDADAAEQSNLKISSKVLSLAVLVKGPRQK